MSQVTIYLPRDHYPDNGRQPEFDDHPYDGRLDDPIIIRGSERELQAILVDITESFEKRGGCWVAERGVHWVPSSSVISIDLEGSILDELPDMIIQPLSGAPHCTRNGKVRSWPSVGLRRLMEEQNSLLARLIRKLDA